MKEVEVKILEIDQATVESKLTSLGATETLDEDEETVFFDFPDSTITKAKNLLRLRRIGKTTTLGFKEFVASDSAKVRIEHEVIVSDFEAANSILRCLGLLPTARLSKHRRSYSLEGRVRVDVDTYTGAHSNIPTLLEIEGADITTVYAHAKLLGFEPERCKSWTTFELLDYYSNKGRS